MTIGTVVDARKERIDADEAWELIRAARSITTARGRKHQAWDPRTDDKAAILKQVMGPSGNLRAPTFRVGDAFVVGFSPGFYAEWVGEGE